MKIEVRRYDEVVILRFVGEFDNFNLPLFQERIDKRIAGGDTKFIFDVRLLKFISSSALGYLITMSKELKSRGGELVLARPSRFVQKTLLTLGLEGVFPVLESVEEALRHLRPTDDARPDAVPMVFRPAGSPEADDVRAEAVPMVFRPTGSPEADDVPNQVGRIVAFHHDGLRFRCELESRDDVVFPFLAVGRTLRLTFRLPPGIDVDLCTLHAHIVGVHDVAPPGDPAPTLFVHVRFDDLGAKDRERLRPFWSDDGPSGGGGVLARIRPRPSADSGHAIPEPPPPDDAG